MGARHWRGLRQAYAAGVSARPIRAHAERPLHDRPMIMAALVEARTGRLANLIARGNPLLTPMAETWPFVLALPPIRVTEEIGAPERIRARQFPRAWIIVSCSHLITLHRRGSGFVLRVDYARWGQTPEDLRHLAVSAPHARTRERALALFDITQHRCATQVAVRTGRRAHTVMDWVHAYNQGGPAALAFRRTGGRRPLFAHSAKPNSARRSAPPSARPRRRP